MSSTSNSSPMLGLTLLGDSITAAAASLWPWSTASLEARRLRLDGRSAGAITDIYYLVSFDEAVPDRALEAIRGAGFTIRDPSPHGGFLTVRGRIRLRAYDLMIASARLERTVEVFGAFATLIGAAHLTSEEPGHAGAPSGRRVGRRVVGSDVSLPGE